MTDLLSLTALEFGFGHTAVFPDLSIARIPEGSKPDAAESDFKPRHCRRQLLDECSIRNTALRNQAPRSGSRRSRDTPGLAILPWRVTNASCICLYRASVPCMRHERFT